MSKPWEQYFIISSDIPREERLALIASLNQIWRFHDNEGQALIEQAFRNNGAPIEVISTTATDTQIQEVGSRPNMRQVLQINFEEERYRGWRSADGQPVKASLTASLAHELYHIADDRRDIETKTLHVVSQMTGFAINSPEMLSMQRSAEHMRASGRARTTFEALATIALRPNLLMDLGDVYQSPLMNRLVAIPTERRLEHLRTAGVVHSDNLSALYEYGAIGRDEHDATRFTDMLLLKNLGPNEPMRGIFINSVRLEPEQKDAGRLLLRPSRSTPFTSAGFEAAAYDIDGVSSPPRVLPSAVRDRS